MQRMARKFMPLLAAVIVAVATLAIGTVSMPSARADKHPVPKNPCGAFYKTSVPSSGKLKISITVRCEQIVAEIYHGVTIQRRGWVKTGIKNCWNVKSCTFTKTVPNPRGSQRWEVHDDWNRRNVPLGGWLGYHNYQFTFRK